MHAFAVLLFRMRLAERSRGPGLTPGPSPGERGARQAQSIAACVRFALCFVLENLFLFLPPTIEIVGFGSLASTKSRGIAVIRNYSVLIPQNSALDSARAPAVLLVVAPRLRSVAERSRGRSLTPNRSTVERVARQK